MKNYQLSKKELTDIAVLSRSYINHKRVLDEAERGIFAYKPHRLEASKRMVEHIEAVTESLPEMDRIIIENVVLKGKTGRWYDLYFSAPTYYRIRKRAFKTFLNNL